EGRFHRFKNVTSLPRPTQKPHPPIWIAAVVTPESFVWAGERGYNMMVVPYLGEHHELAEKLQLYRQAYRDHGHEARRGPGEVMTQFAYLRHTFGVVYPSFQINFGMMEKPRARRSLELFARQVMPNFR